MKLARWLSACAWLVSTEARSCAETTKRAVYLEEAHVDRAAFWVVVHRVLLVEARRLCEYGFVDSDVLVGTRAGVN
jgi:hypothetical protein